MKYFLMFVLFGQPTNPFDGLVFETKNDCEVVKKALLQAYFTKVTSIGCLVVK